MIFPKVCRFNEKGGFFYVITEECHCCPVCKGSLSVIGTRKRGLKENESEKKTLIIRRLRCENIHPGRIHHELPDCVVPYKRYSADTIESIIENKTINNDKCPESTARRWLRWWRVIKPYLLSILSSLSEKYGTRFGNPPAYTLFTLSDALISHIPFVAAFDAVINARKRVFVCFVCYSHNNNLFRSNDLSNYIPKAFLKNSA